MLYLRINNLLVLKHFIQNLFHRSLQTNMYSRAWFTMIGIVIKECRIAFQQFFSWKYPVFTVIRSLWMIMVSLSKLIFGRSIRYSFGHFGEDRIIDGILKPLITTNGFYVDVGCHHPVFLSNTYGLYRRGWRGVCVDANESMIRQFKRLRPRDQAVAALVSDESTERDFYLMENPGLSTTEVKNLTHEDAKGIAHQKVRLSPKTLTTILHEANAPCEFELLCIDVEEHDLNVLKSLDFNKYRPRLVVVEDETFEINACDQNEIYKHMVTQGYRCEGYLLKNLYFIRKGQLK